MYIASVKVDLRTLYAVFSKLYFMNINLRTQNRQYSVCTLYVTQEYYDAVRTKLLRRIETRRQGAEGAAVAEFSTVYC